MKPVEAKRGSVLHNDFIIYGRLHMEESQAMLLVKGLCLFCRSLLMIDAPWQDVRDQNCW